MAFVNATPTVRTRPKRATDPYSAALRARPSPQIDVYQFPAGSLQGFLAGLEDIADGGTVGGTGIDFLDENVTAIRKQVEDAALAAKITALCSLAAGLASVLLLIRTGR